MIDWEHHAKSGVIPAPCLRSLKSFYFEYKKAAAEANPSADLLFISFLEQIASECLHPIPFSPFHQMMRAPFDYYQFSLNFIEPLLIKQTSSLTGKDSLQKIVLELKKNENAIFFANHQTEADPQILSALLKDSFPELAESMIFVAGTRVTSDPLAIPFSRGTNLLCIHSKRYIEHPPELKAEKQRHNQRTMELMRHLLAEGGKAIYVAPSGGRDRKNEKGLFSVAPFDPASIEMFYLMAKRSKRPTHFYPMALKTHAILPPPETIQIELGEERLVGRSAVHIHIGKEINLQECPSIAGSDKHAQRVHKTQYIHDLVVAAYNNFPND